MPDPTPEIYALFDKAGLSSANLLQGRKSMSQIVADLRLSLATELVAFIKERDKRA